MVKYDQINVNNLWKIAAKFLTSIIHKVKDIICLIRKAGQSELAGSGLRIIGKRSTEL